MKYFFLLMSLFVSTVGTAMAYEKPNYIVLTTDKNIELRRYEPMLTAEVTVEGDYEGMKNDGFRILADYIFGNNIKESTKGSEDIAMTVPVTVEPASENIAMIAPVTVELREGTKEKWTMRFMMPSKYNLETLPKPKDPRVKIVEIAGFDALAVRFSWLFSVEDYKKYSGILKDYAAKENIELKGLPYSAQYDSPFTLPFMRRNEVLWQVETRKN